MIPTIERMIEGLLSGDCTKQQVVAWLRQIEAERDAAYDALAVSILGEDYLSRNRAQKHVVPDDGHISWARQRMGASYDPTCQYPVKSAIDADSQAKCAAFDAAIRAEGEAHG